METWGSWSFSKDNETLLTEVLNKFATDQCSLDVSRKCVLSTLAASQKLQVDIASSSSDNSDVDDDFRSCYSTFCPVANIEPEAQVAENVSLDNTAPRNLESELSFLQESQRPEVDRENASKLIAEMLNAGEYDAREMCALLNTERRNRPDVSELIGEVWSEIVTDKGRHGLCEVLIEVDVKPQYVCQQVYLRWFKTFEPNLTGFIDSLSKLIVHFPEYACKSFLIELLRDKDSVLVKHVDWLSDIMRSLDQQHWCSLLSEYMKSCDILDQHQIPVLLHLVKNCRQCLNSNEAERLVALCRNASLEHSANRDFAVFLLSVIGAIKLSKFRKEMTDISGRLKGASKILIMKALKDVK